MDTMEYIGNRKNVVNKKNKFFKKNNNKKLVFIKKKFFFIKRYYQMLNAVINLGFSLAMTFVILVSLNYSMILAKMYININLEPLLISLATLAIIAVWAFNIYLTILMGVW